MMNWRLPVNLATVSLTRYDDNDNFYLDDHDDNDDGDGNDDGDLIPHIP